MAELIFEQLLPAPSADLVFGDAGGALTGGDAQVRVAAPLPPVRARLWADCVEIASARYQMALPPVRAGLRLQYASGVSRSLGVQAAARWERAQTAHAALESAFGPAAPVVGGGQQMRGRFEQSQSLARGWRGHWADALGLDAWALGRSQQALPLGRDWRAGFESALSVRGHVRDRAQQALQVRAHWRLAMQTAVMLRCLVRSAVQQGTPLRLDVAGDATVALRLPGVAFVGVWQQAMLVPPRERQPRPGEQGPGPVTCYVPDADLVFCRKPDGTADLVFECRDCEGLGAGAIRVPVRRVYIVQNSISLTRTEGGVALHPLSFSLSLDADSWTWSWSATLPQAAGAHLGRQADGEPPVLEAVINGQAVHLRLESRALDERFLPTRWQVGGRGANAILAEPHAPVMGFAVPTPMAAQQLAQHVLTHNGVGIGWEVDWQIDDWHVPAGAWMHRGTHMSALAEMARAVGAYVQPEFTNRAIRILPRYPVAPWDWAGVTPQIELPSALAEMRSTDCIDRPVYDRVWVGGESAGVAGFVTRAGTLGEQVAEQVIHPLITDGTAQRMRGLAELANTGRQEHVTIGLQVLPQTGLILPGTWVRHTFPDGNGRQVLGIVRRLEVSYRMPKLRQYITLETHPYV